MLVSRLGPGVVAELEDALPPPPRERDRALLPLSGLEEEETPPRLPAPPNPVASPVLDVDALVPGLVTPPKRESPSPVLGALGAADDAPPKREEADVEAEVLGAAAPKREVVETELVADEEGNVAEVPEAPPNKEEDPPVEPLLEIAREGEAVEEV